MMPIRGVFLALGCGMGLLVPFQAVVLAGKGFDAASIGLVLALAAAAGVVASPVWGHLGDTMLGRARVLALAACGSAIALVAFGVGALPLVTGLTWVLYSAAAATLVPTADAVAVNEVRLAGRGDFGRLRVVLSVSFGVAAIASGFLYDTTGYAPAPFLAAAVLSLLVLAGRFLPHAGRSSAPGALAHRRGGSVAEAFAVQPRLPAVLITFALGSVCLLAVFTYLPLRLEELGGSPSDVALASGLESFAEVPGFIAAGWVARRLGIRVLFLSGALLMTGCGVALAVLTEPSLMVGMRLLTGIAYAGITVAAVLALAALLPTSLQATAQNLNAMTAGIASIAVGLLGGLLYEVAGAPSLFLLTAAATLAAGLLGLGILPRRTRPRPGVASSG